jgi:hypothetical protein
MSGLFDSKLAVEVGSEPALVYEPATEGVAMSLLLTNKHFGTLPVSAWIERGTETIHLAVSKRVLAGHPYEALAGSKVALQAGDKIYAKSVMTGAFSAILSAYKDQ